MQTTVHGLSADAAASFDAARMAIDRMVSYLCEDEQDRRDRWIAGARTPDEVHRRLMAWREREARLARRADVAVA